MNTINNRFDRLYDILKAYFGEYLPHGILLEKAFEIEVRELGQQADAQIEIMVFPYGRPCNAGGRNDATR